MPEKMFVTVSAYTPPGKPAVVNVYGPRATRQLAQREQRELLSELERTDPGELRYLTTYVRQVHDIDAMNAERDRRDNL